MRELRCVNGHDVTGVERSSCPHCGAEVQTVVAARTAGDADGWAVGSRWLALFIALVLAMVAATLVVGPVGGDAFPGSMLWSSAE